MHSLAPYQHPVLGTVSHSCFGARHRTHLSFLCEVSRPVDIWFSESAKEYQCARPECGKVIAPNTFMANSSRKLGRQITTDHWHADCLITFSMEMLASAKQHVVVGRKRLELDQTTHDARIRILHQYAANRQRMEHYRGRLPDPVLSLRIRRLEVLQQLLRMEIMKCGGPPCSWTECGNQPDSTQCEVNDGEDGEAPKLHMVQ